MSLEQRQTSAGLAHHPSSFLNYELGTNVTYGGGVHPTRR